MSGWSGQGGEEGAGSGSGEDRGGAAWSPGAPPPWAYEETRTAPAPGAGEVPPPPPPPWATAHTRAGAPPVPPPPSSYGPVPTPSHGPAPVQRPFRGGRLIALVAAMVLVGTGTGLGVWYVGRDRGSGGSPQASAPATAVPVSTAAPPDSPSGSPAPTPSSSPPPSQGTPAGYRLVHDSVGYAIAVPRGWTRREEQGEKAAVVFYDSPSDGRRLQIFRLAEATVTESLDLAENDPGYGYSREPGYQALSRRSGDTWAELTYRYDDPDKGARRVVDHRFQAPDGTLYAIRASGPEHLPATRVRAPLTTALTTFCPTDTTCA
ncbi:hypothetical protein [Streptomyces bungoensis]|uniref:hypothetical protein n=1 Tax=Streptomyces bungoensis TaxID=285568 RepID=UPI0033DAC609